MAGFGESISKDLTPEEFTRFRDYINQHAGIFLEEQKMDSLRISLITRATRHECTSLEQYYQRLTTDEDEFKELLNLVTINETSFFRFPQQFDALRNTVVPEILAGKHSSDRRFRVWSAGCSTGEEPYTIAMTLLDSGLEGLGYTPDVLGTDVSTNALLKAKQGIYPASSLLSVPPTLSNRFFVPTPNGYQVSEAVRKLVTFQYHNLIEEPYPIALMGNWDVIFCRNVTIYFRLDSTRRVIQNFYDSLNPGGYLFIGHSETLASISDRFDPVEVEGIFLYRKPRNRRPLSLSAEGGAAASDKRSGLRYSVPRIPGVTAGGSLNYPGSARDSAVASLRPKLSETLQAALPVSKAAGIERGAEVTDTERGVDLIETEHSAELTDTERTAEVAELLKKAESALAEGDYSTVFAAVERILDFEPHNPDAYLLAASAHADIGDLDAAHAECEKVLAIDPLIAAARYILGMIHLRRGEKTLALSEFKRTVYIDSGFVLAHLNLANLYKSLGAIQDACREYELTLKTLYENPDGSWTAFMGGFKADLLAKTVERSLVECRKCT